MRLTSSDRGMRRARTLVSALAVRNGRPQLPRVGMVESTRSRHGDSVEMLIECNLHGRWNAMADMCKRPELSEARFAVACKCVHLWMHNFAPHCCGCLSLLRLALAYLTKSLISNSKQHSRLLTTNENTTSQRVGCSGTKVQKLIKSVFIHKTKL